MPSLQQLSLTDRKDEKNISGIDAFAGFKDLSSRTAEGRREPYTPKVLAEVLRNNPNLEALFVDPFFLQPCPEFVESAARLRVLVIPSLFVASNEQREAHPEYYHSLLDLAAVQNERQLTERAKQSDKNYLGPFLLQYLGYFPILC